MQYVRLGRSGLKVSRIALGCMSYGDPSRGFNTWSLDEEASQPFFRQAVELCSVLELGELPGEHRRGPDVAGFSCLDDIVVGLHRLCDRCFRVEAVEQIHIHEVGAEPRE